MTSFEVFKEELHAYLSKEKNILVTGHVSPDDDSTGSCLAAAHYINEYSASKARVVYEGDESNRWESFEGYDQVKFVDELPPHTKHYDACLFLDAHELSRFTNEDEFPLSKKAFCIDHHPISDACSFETYWVDETRASTSDMVYDALYAEQRVSSTGAEAMLLGILGDTGNFRYVGPENAEVFRVAEQLVSDAEIRIESLQSRYGSIRGYAYDVFKKLISHSETIEVEGWPKMMCSYVAEEEVAPHNDAMRSTGAHLFVSWPKRIEGVEWGFVLTPRSNDMVAASFRSLPGSVNVGDMAERLGIGGGHDRASGGRFEDMTAEAAFEEVLSWMRNNEPRFS